MNGARIHLAETNFKCPYCGKDYNDDNDEYLDRCNKNLSSYTKIKCTCGERFGMTYNYMSDAGGFKLTNICNPAK